MANTKKKQLPEIRSEDEERDFWANRDSSEYIDWSSARTRKLSNLRPSLRTISIRLPTSMVEDLKNSGKQARCSLPVPPQGFPGRTLEKRAAPHVVNSGGGLH